MKRQTITIILLALCIIPLVGLAEARTVNFSGVYTDINLFGGERLKVFNDEAVQHSITGYNGTFDSGLIGPNGITDMGFYTDGDYAFYDQHNPNNVGIIHVRTQEAAQARLDAGFQHEAGDTFTITGTDFTPDHRVDIEIIKPDGTTYHNLQVMVTSEGKISLPISTSRTDQNGVYNVNVVNNKQASTSFIINGGVTSDNPTEVAPVTTSNATSTEPATQITQDTSASSSNSTSTLPSDKQALIDWLKQMISYYQQLLAIVEAS